MYKLIMPHTNYTNDPAPWVTLLGTILSSIRLDAIHLRRRGYMDSNGNLTPEGERAFPLRDKSKSRVLVRNCDCRYTMMVVGRLVYKGGLADMLDKLGLPDIGSAVVRDVETRAQKKRRQLSPH